MTVVAGRVFPPALLQELESLEEGSSRRQLARILCERLNWIGPSGRLQLMSGRKALVELQRRGLLKLPPSSFVWPARGALRPSPAPPEPVRCSLEQLGEIQLIAIQGRRSKEGRLWRELMAHHYLGAGPLCGAQLRYLIKSPDRYLGALAFSAAALKVRARDQRIGWSDWSRRHQLHQVVNNSRFLLLPWVEVPNLASHVLGLCARQLGADWRERYGYAPVLLESFVEAERFAGTAYQAAGWECLGQTAGRGRQDRTHQKGQSLKSIWIKPLVANWQEPLVAEPLAPRLASPPPPAPRPAPTPGPADWAQAEMGGAPLGDGRLVQRLVGLTRDFWARPQAQIPEACATRAKTKAAYRFFAHPRVTLNDILAPHREQTLRRLASQRLVLAVQDTTELDYTAHPLTQGLGPIGNHRPQVQGLMLHPTMAYSTTGVPLGLVDLQCWKRDPEHTTQFRQAVEGKESVKWLKSFAAADEVQARCPETTVVSVGDCEADLYELFLKAQQSLQGTKFLVRAYRDRTLEENGAPLWTHLREKDPAGSVSVQLPRRGSRPSRVAELSVRFGAVKLKAPAYLKDKPPVSLWGVILEEQTPPPLPAEPVQWLLLTNLPVESFEQAVEKSQWYGVRFQIEIFFRTLKSGCRMEDRQLGTAHRLENCLAIDLVVAWRITHLVKQGRDTPEVPCTVYFEELEWKALVACAQPGAAPDLSKPPTLREAVRMVAGLGGFLGRKGDGEPGAQTLWTGLQRLDDITLGFTIAWEWSHRPVPSPSDYG